MTNIILISDTHGFLEPKLIKHIEACDELWHAGDIGDSNFFQEIVEQFPNKMIRAVYGNIDDAKTRLQYPETSIFYCEEVKVYITHIGGYPNHYAKGIKEKLISEKPQLFICGHSHILRVMFDDKLKVLHMNPGAAGIHGFHHVKTCLRFKIEKAEIKDLSAIELGKRGALE